MNSRKQSQKPAIRIGVVDRDPLRLVGFRALLESETDFEFIYASISDLDRHGRIDIILLGNQRGQDSFGDVVKLKAFYPDAQIHSNRFWDARRDGSCRPFVWRKGLCG
jgi:hypothetical protein